MFNPGTAGSVVTKLQLSISCRNLHDADFFSKSDPMVVLEQKVRRTSNVLFYPFRLLQAGPGQSSAGRK